MKMYAGIFRYVTLVLLMVGYSASSLAVSWEGIEGKDIVLFYPGQSAWEWVLVPSDHSGAKRMREGKSCRDCHEGEEKEIGSLIVSGEKLEPEPTKGKPGSIPLNVAMTRDADTLYVKFEWTDPGVSSGATGKFESRVTMMIGDEAIKESVLFGCWGTCHNDVKGMPDAGDLNMNKYLAASRTKLGRTGGGENYKSGDDLSALMADGYYMEYMQAKLNPGEPAVAADGYVLRDRHRNEPPLVQADATFEGGKWTVILSRKLDGGDGHKTLEPGIKYPVGFAIHDDYAEHRHHHVSLEYSFAIDDDVADFVATSN
ncbi:MAG: ethylbenzene dehydrogenase-related protein [Pseudomonadales bacterium]